MKFSKLGFICLASLGILFTSCNSEKDTLTIGTGNSGGFYYQYGAALSELAAKMDPAMNIQVKTTAGTAANLRLVDQGFLDLAVVQKDMLVDAAHSAKPVAELYTEVFQIVVKADANIDSIPDLIGKKVSVGETESGVIRNAEIILSTFGINFDMISAKNLSFTESAAALKAGEIDAFFCTAGIPTPAITELSENLPIKILSIDQGTLERLLRLHQEYVISEVQEGIYEGQTAKATTFGVKAVLVANSNTDEKTINAIKGIAAQAMSRK